MKRWGSKVVSFVLLAALVWMGIQPTSMKAADMPEQFIQDPGAGRLDGSKVPEAFYQDAVSNREWISQSTSDTTVGPWDGKTYIHNSRYDTSSVLSGIDVSKYQGTIDWEKVKADGVDFVFIRAGYRGYGASGVMVTDPMFEENIKGATAAGIPVGAYFFSQAITEAEGVEEAEYLLNLVQGYSIRLPLVIDFEYATSSSGANAGRLYQAKLSKETATNICTAFSQTIMNAGYDPMIYANSQMLTKQLSAETIQNAGYKVWLAHYTTKTSYNGDYTFWQYSSKGTVDGISGWNGSTNKVDCNFWYTEEADQLPPAPDDENSENQEEGITLSDKDLRLMKGETAVIKASLSPDISSDSLIYQSADTRIASVSPTGEVTALSAGNTEISVTSSSGKRAVCEVTVMESIQDYEVTSLAKSYSYTGNKIKPDIQLNYDDKRLKKGTDFKVTYTSNTSIGTATGTITGLGFYTGTKTISFRIIPKKVTGLKRISSTKNGIRFQWNKVVNSDGYVIYRSSSPNGKFKKVKTISKSKTVSWTNQKLAAGREYYYKIRAFKTVDGTRYYGKYSAVIALQTKGSSIAAKTKQSAELKSKAGNTFDTRITIGKNKTVNVLCKTEDRSGNLWFKVKYNMEGESYIGYLPSKVLQLS